MPRCAGVRPAQTPYAGLVAAAQSAHAEMPGHRSRQMAAARAGSPSNHSSGSWSRQAPLAIALYFVPGLGHIKLVDLRAGDIKALYGAMKKISRAEDGRWLVYDE